MKSTLILSVLFVSLLINCSTNAQSTPTATYSAKTGIMISTSHPLGDTYEIDIKSFKWTKADAKAKLVELEDQTEYIGLELDYDRQKFILTLERDQSDVKKWNIKQWNEHLAEIR